MIAWKIKPLAIGELNNDRESLIIIGNNLVKTNKTNKDKITNKIILNIRGT